MKYLTCDTKICCIHGGVVNIQPPAQRSLKINGKLVLCKEDLVGASIQGCMQTGPGLKPCTKVTALLVGESRGVKVDGKTPLLEMVIALTDGSPPGICFAGNADNFKSIMQINVASLANQTPSNSLPSDKSTGVNSSDRKSNEPEFVGLGPPSQPEEPSSDSSDKDNKAWFKITLHDEDDEPFVEELVSIVLPEKEESNDFFLDQEGNFYWESIKDGKCKVYFPNLKNCWPPEDSESELDYLELETNKTHSFKIKRNPIADEIPDYHILLEYIAHHIVYEPMKLEKPPKQLEILRKAGYKADSIRDILWSAGPYGFQACLLIPNGNNAPVLAIRGTYSPGGASTDLDFDQVGDNQFQANESHIKYLLQKAGVKVDITGHSLGGAVAQIIATKFPQKIKNVVTFQAPGINSKTFSIFENILEKDRPTVVHHIARYDLVDLAGFYRLPGTIYEHDRTFPLRRIFDNSALSEAFKPHTTFHFTTDVFTKRRERLGLEDKFIIDVIKKEIRIDCTRITRYDSDPYYIKRKFIEIARTYLSIRLAALIVPIIDKYTFWGWRPDRKLPVTYSQETLEKINKILDYLEDWTSDNDVQEIIKIICDVKNHEELAEIKRNIEPYLNVFFFRFESSRQKIRQKLNHQSINCD